jgi:undecaprenyl-diphosphatase
MGIVQGMTEFLPVSSSGHLIIVPWLFGWTNPFIDSLAFTVMIHFGTLGALLVYFSADWVRLVPAGLAAMRDRSFEGEPDRKLAWLIVVATIPATLAGLLLNEVVEERFRQIGLVATMLVIGAAILWLAERNGRRDRSMADVTLRTSAMIGAAQAIALIPGISRSGISISAGLFAGLDRETAARFSFLMATPITALAGSYEAFKLVRGEAGVAVEPLPLIVGVVSALVSGLLAIAVLLRFLRTNPTHVFVAYRIALAVVVVVAWLGIGR